MRGYEVVRIDDGPDSRLEFRQYGMDVVSAYPTALTKPLPDLELWDVPQPLNTLDAQLDRANDGLWIGLTTLCVHCEALIEVVDLNAMRHGLHPQVLTWRHATKYFACYNGTRNPVRYAEAS